MAIQLKRAGLSSFTIYEKADRIGGTWLLDAPNFSFLNSPVFCAVCKDTQRDNDDLILKASYFMSTNNGGTHDFVFGYDSFTDINVIENHQSGSDFQVWTFQPFIVRGQDVYPQFTANGSNVLRWDPVLEATQGMHFQTDSLFFNDSWRIDPDCPEWTSNDFGTLNSIIEAN